MKKLIFENINEEMYQEKLDNGIEIYMYPTNKTKNYYITISVKYGANVLKYKLGDNIFNIIPGSAHFLEHKIMSFSEDKKIVNRINKYGLTANAWTNWFGTNYNVYGSENINESLILLLDMFYNPNITDKNVESEKYIISEEIDMSNDNLNVLMINKLLNNLFNKSSYNKTILGSKNDIFKITKESLNKIYNDFYIPKNTFITLTGNFNVENVLEIINEYFKINKIKEKQLPKRIKEQEIEKVRISYEKINKDIVSTKIKIGYKIKKNVFNIKNNDDLKSYINIILNSNLDISSPLYEKYKNEDLIVNMFARSYIFDDYLIIIVSATTNKPEEFIEQINKDIKNMKIDKEIFERKKKLFLKSYILDFEDIIDIEDLITLQILKNNKIDTKEYTNINNLNYKTASDVIKKLNFNNYSIIVASK